MDLTGRGCKKCAAFTVHENEDNVYRSTTYKCIHDYEREQLIKDAIEACEEGLEKIVMGETEPKDYEEIVLVSEQVVPSHLITTDHNISRLLDCLRCERELLLKHNIHSNYLLTSKDYDNTRVIVESGEKEYESVAEMYMSNVWKGYVHDTNIQWSDTVTIEVVFDPDASDGQPLPPFVPLEQGLYRINYESTFNGRGVVVVSVQDQKRNQIDRLFSAGQAIHNSGEMRFTLEGKGNISYVWTKKSGIAGVISLRIQRGQHAECMTSLSRVVKPITIDGTPTVSVANELGVMVRNSELGVKIQSPVELKPKTIINIGNEVSAKITGPVKVDPTQPIVAKFWDGIGVSKPVWISEHAHVAGPSGWQRDLTREGIESNPGPMTTALLDWLSELSQIPDHLRFDVTSIDMPIYYHKGMHFVAQIKALHSDWYKIESQTVIDIATDMNMCEGSHFVASYLLCTAQYHWVYYQILFGSSDAESTVTDAYWRLRAYYDHDEAWSSTLDWFTENEPRKGANILANRQRHAYNGNPFSHTMKDVDDAQGVEAIVVKGETEGKLFDVRDVMGSTEMGKRSEIFNTVPLSKQHDNGIWGSIESPIGNLEDCFIRYPWTCVHPVHFYPIDYRENPSTKKDGAQKELNRSALALSGQPLRPNKDRPVNGIGVSYEATQAAIEINRDTENSKVYRLSARDRTSQGFYRTDVNDINGLKPDGYDTTESMLLKLWLRGSISKHENMNYFMRTWSMFNIFDPWARPFLRHQDDVDSTRFVAKDNAEVFVNHPWVWQTGHGTRFPDNFHRFFPFLSGPVHGQLRFHVSLATVPENRRSNAVFVPMWLLELHGNPPLSLALLIMAIAPWPYGIHTMRIVGNLAHVANGDDGPGAKDEDVELDRLIVEAIDGICRLKDMEEEVNRGKTVKPNKNGPEDGNPDPFGVGVDPDPPAPNPPQPEPPLPVIPDPVPTTDTDAGGKGAAAEEAEEDAEKNKGDADKPWYEPARSGLLCKMQYYFFQSMNAISGMTDIDIILPSKSLDGQATNANALAYMMPRAGPTTIGTMEKDAPLDYYRGREVGLHNLVDYLLSWDSAFGTDACNGMAVQIAKYFSSGDLYGQMAELGVSLSWRTNMMMAGLSEPKTIVPMMHTRRPSEVRDHRGHATAYFMPAPFTMPINLNLSVNPNAEVHNDSWRGPGTDDDVWHNEELVLDGYPWNSWPMRPLRETFCLGAFNPISWNRVILLLSKVNRSTPLVHEVLWTSATGIRSELFTAAVMSCTWNAVWQGFGIQAVGWINPGRNWLALHKLKINLFGPTQRAGNFACGSLDKIYRRFMRYMFDSQVVEVSLGETVKMCYAGRFLCYDLWAFVMWFSKVSEEKDNPPHQISDWRAVGYHGCCPVTIPDVMFHWFTDRVPKYMSSFVCHDRLDATFGYYRGLETFGNRLTRFLGYGEHKLNRYSVTANELIIASDEFRWNVRLIGTTNEARLDDWTGRELDSRVVFPTNWTVWAEPDHVNDENGPRLFKASTTCTPYYTHEGQFVYAGIDCARAGDIVQRLNLAMKRLSPLFRECWYLKGIAANEDRGWQDSDNIDSPWFQPESDFQVGDGSRPTIETDKEMAVGAIERAAAITEADAAEPHDA